MIRVARCLSPFFWIVILTVLAFYPVISLIVLIYLNLQARKKIRVATDNASASPLHPARGVEFFSERAEAGVSEKLWRPQKISWIKNEEIEQKITK
jgi:hypothetical protein